MVHASLLVLFAAAALFFLGRTAWAAWRKQWASVRKLLALVSITLLSGWLLLVARVSVGWSGVVIFDQPLEASGGPTRALLDDVDGRLRAAGANRLAALIVDQTTSASPRSALSWRSCAAGSGVLAELVATAVHVPEMDQALDYALEGLHETPWTEWLTDLFWQRKRRVVVLQSDREHWLNLAEIDLDRRFRQARRDSVALDFLELDPVRETASIECTSELNLPAHKPLPTTHRQLQVTIRGPALSGLQNEPVSGMLSGRLLGCGAILDGFEVTGAQVSPNETIEISLPLAEFQGEGTNEGPELEPHFAGVDLRAELTVGAKKVRAHGVSYLPVRTPRAWAVCGNGHPAAGLRTACWDAPTLAPPHSPTELHERFAPLLTKPRGDGIGDFEFIDTTEFAKRLEGSARLPDIAILHELAPADWTPDLIKRLHAQVRKGLHLVVLDPPILPDDGAAQAELKALLPVWSYAHGSAGGPDKLPQTIDRSPVLLFAFDYNALWSAADASQVHGLEAQVQIAEGILGQYRHKGLVHGTLHIRQRVAGDPSSCLVEYEPSAGSADRIQVCMASKISSAPKPASPCDPTLANFLLPSLGELRLAAAFPHLTPDELAKAGLKTSDAPAPLLRLLESKATYLPNVAVVLFVTERAPQPQPDVPLNSDSQIHFLVNHNSADVRVLKQTPTRMAARLALHGVHVAAIGLSAPPLPGSTEPGLEHGLRELTVQWPVNEPFLFSKFQTSPSVVLGAQFEAAVDGLLDSYTTAGSWAIDRSGALARRWTSGAASVYFASLDVTAASWQARSTTLGKELADRWLPLHGAPHNNHFGVITQYNRAVDERFGPLLTLGEAARLQTHDAPTLDAEYKEEWRWAGPCRYRRLEVNPAYAAMGAVAHVRGVVPAKAFPFGEPAPLLVGSRCRQGHVYVAAYSPFEGPATGAAWPLQDVIYDPSSAEVDRLGLQRLLDVVTFVGRVRPPPSERPEVRSIRPVDARGGLLLEIEFTPQHLTDGTALQPRLYRADQATDTPKDSVPLTMSTLSGRRGLATFLTAPKPLLDLFTQQEEELRVECRFRADQAGVIFPIRRPSKHDWSDLNCLEAVQSLQGFTGGQYLPVGAAFVQPQAMLRFWGMIGLLAVVCFSAGSKTLKRLLSKDFARQAREERERLKVLAEGTAEPPGDYADERTTTRRSALEIVRKTILQGNCDWRALVRKEILLDSFGYPTLLHARRWPAEHAYYSLLVCNVGESMRLQLQRGRFEAKVRLAAVAAQFLGAEVLRQGSELTLALSGRRHAREPWQYAGNWNGQLGAGEMDRLLSTAAAQESAPLPDPALLNVSAGTSVYWISDFVEEITGDSERWLRWAQAVQANGGQVTAVHVATRAEQQQTGWVVGAAPGGLLDRTAQTPADVAAKLTEHVAELRARCQLAHVPLVCLHSLMSVSEFIAAFRQAEVI